MSVNYPYSLSSFLNNKVYEPTLTDEIRTSSISIALDYIYTDNGTVNIYFKATLSGGEQTTLSGIVAAHQGEPINTSSTLTTATGVPLEVSSSALVNSSTSGLIFAGVDFDSKVRYVSVLPDGVLKTVNVSGSIVTSSVFVSNFPSVQQVTGSVLSLPFGIQQVTGSISITGQPVTVQGIVTSIVTGTLNTNVSNQVTVTSTGSLPVTVSGVQTVTGTVAIVTPSATATVTSVASSATNVILLNANANRSMATFYNDSTQRLYLKLGSTASTTSFTVILTAGSYYELPTPVYRGQIDGIWSSANGSVRITELV